MKYSYMIIKDQKPYVKFDFYGIESDLDHMIFRDRYDNEFVFMRRRNIIKFCVTLSVICFILGKLI